MISHNNGIAHSSVRGRKAGLDLGFCPCTANGCGVVDQVVTASVGETTDMMPFFAPQDLVGPCHGECRGAASVIPKFLGNIEGDKRLFC